MKNRQYILWLILMFVFYCFSNFVRVVPLYAEKSVSKIPNAQESAKINIGNCSDDMDDETESIANFEGRNGKKHRKKWFCDRAKDGDRGIGSKCKKTKVRLCTQKRKIKRGESTTLKWKCRRTESCELTPDTGPLDPNGSGTIKVSPKETTKYTLVGNRNGRVVKSSVTVKVENEPPPVTIVQPPDGAKISLGTTDALEVITEFGNPSGIVNDSFSAQINGEDITDLFTFAETGANGAISTRLPTGSNTLSITVLDSKGRSRTESRQFTVSYHPPTVKFSADPQVVDFSESTTLSWQTTNADKVVIEPGIGEVELSDSISATLQEKKTYTITATGPGGEVTSSVKLDTSEPFDYLRGVQPFDLNKQKERVVDAGAKYVGLNFKWMNWEPEPKRAPCDGNTEIEFDGFCYIKDEEEETDKHAYEWLQDGVEVVAILYGSPDWNRVDGCDEHSNVQEEIFCAPKEPGGFARFAAMIADRYDGTKGYGKISHFVVWNEVDHETWFNCGSNCESTDDNIRMDRWVQSYVDLYASTYDAVKEEQLDAKVLVSLTNHFAREDIPQGNGGAGHISGRTFLNKFGKNPSIVNRDWALAYHAYPDPFTCHDLDEATDRPQVTLGNVGEVVGWLMKNFPNDEHAWHVYLTEQGINSYYEESCFSQCVKDGHSNDYCLETWCPDNDCEYNQEYGEQRQAELLCQAIENVAGTPFIDMFLYHYGQDEEHKVSEWAPGLIRVDGTEKPAWRIWAEKDSCGRQNLRWVAGKQHEMTIMKRGYNGRYHWITSRTVPTEFGGSLSSEESLKWELFRNKPEDGPETQMLYQCRIGYGTDSDHTLVHKLQSCGNGEPMGPMGYIYTSPYPGTEKLVRCQSPDTNDHLVSPNRCPAGWNQEMVLGWAYRFDEEN